MKAQYKSIIGGLESQLAAAQTEKEALLKMCTELMDTLEASRAGGGGHRGG